MQIIRSLQFLQPQKFIPYQSKPPAMKLALAFLSIPCISAYDVWPLPASYTTGTTTLSLSPSLTFTLDDATISNDVLTGAFTRYAEAISGGMGCGDTRSLLSQDESPNAEGEVSSCTVSISNGSDSPSLSYTTDESYSIDIDEDGKVRNGAPYYLSPRCNSNSSLRSSSSLRSPSVPNQRRHRVRSCPRSRVTLPPRRRDLLHLQRPRLALRLA